jgi:hypothetical protein
LSLAHALKQPDHGGVTAGLVARRRFQCGADPVQFHFGQMLDTDELVARMADRADQLVELGLDRRSIAILRILCLLYTF